MSRKSYIPLAELSGEVADHVEWHLMSIPDYVAEKIGVNIGRMDRLARVTGLGSIAVYGYSGDRSEEIHGISGIDSQGTAAASFTRSIVKAELQKNSLDEPLENHPVMNLQEYRLARGRIDINTNELDRKVGDKVRDEAAWAKNLNGALKQGSRKLVLEKLLLKYGFADFMPVIFSAWASAQMTTSWGGGPAYFPAYFVGWQQTINIGRMAYAKAIYGKRGEFKYMPSLFAAAQFDRLAAAGSLTALPLVKPLKENG